MIVLGLIKSFAFTAVLALISIWILNALYLGLNVFISDFCMRPNQYTIEIADKNHIAKGNIKINTQ